MHGVRGWNKTNKENSREIYKLIARNAKYFWDRNISRYKTASSPQNKPLTLFLCEISMLINIITVDWRAALIFSPEIIRADILNVRCDEDVNQNSSEHSVKLMIFIWFSSLSFLFNITYVYVHTLNIRY